MRYGVFVRTGHENEVRTAAVPEAGRPPCLASLLASLIAHCFSLAAVSPEDGLSLSSTLRSRAPSPMSRALLCPVRGSHYHQRGPGSDPHGRHERQRVFPDGGSGSRKLPASKSSSRDSILGCRTGVILDARQVRTIAPTLGGRGGCHRGHDRGDDFQREHGERPDECRA